MNPHTPAPCQSPWELERQPLGKSPLPVALNGPKNPSPSTARAGFSQSLLPLRAAAGQLELPLGYGYYTFRLEPFRAFLHLKLDGLPL